VHLLFLTNAYYLFIVLVTVLVHVQTLEVWNRDCNRHLGAMHVDVGLFYQQRTNISELVRAITMKER
jgi:hypothetical protein